MSEVQIKFTTYGSSSQTGNFGPGDLMRCSKDQADHFVNDARCAEYVNKPAKEHEAPAKKAKGK